MEQMIRAEATTLELGAGMALAHAISPRMGALEKGLDVTVSTRGWSRLPRPRLDPDGTGRETPPLRFGPELLLAEPNPHRTPSDSKGPEKHFLSQMTELENKAPSLPPVAESGPAEKPAASTDVTIEFSPELIERLRKAKRVTVLTGAGLSAESGIPTFRDGATALWANVSMDEVATPEAFEKDPGKVWRWHAEQFERYLHARPNEGHLALAEMAKRFPHFTVITQNIDGLHQEAGSKKVIELHGSVLRARCPTENKVVEQWEKTGKTPPRCPDCSGPLRHDVVWFKEELPEESLTAAFEATDSSDVFFSIGTSSRVNPAASLARRAVSRNQTVVEINPHETMLTPWATFVIRESAGKALPALVQALDLADKTVPTETEFRETLAARYVDAFPRLGKKIVGAVLDMKGGSPLFKERLLEAYSADPKRGSLGSVMTVFAIRDLFYGDAVTSSLGNFEAALLQTYLRRAAALEDGPSRIRAYLDLFEKMEEGLDRMQLVQLFWKHGLQENLNVSRDPVYPPAFLKAHEEALAPFFENYREADRILLLNLVHELAPTDSTKARRLIRILSQAKKSPDYPSSLIDRVLDHARFHALGKLLLKRMLQVFVVEDLPGKLKDLLHDGPKSGTFSYLTGLQKQGLSIQEMARRIRGTHHNAYLNDERLARKIVIASLEIKDSLSHFSKRSENLTRMREIWSTHLETQGELTPDFWFRMMGHDPEEGRYNALAGTMKDMVEKGDLRIVPLSSESFDDIVQNDPVLKGCDLMFFLQASHEGEPHQIIMRDLDPRFNEADSDPNLSFNEILRRVKGLSHEATHLLQATGREESIVPDLEPFDFSEIGREERLASEIMAFQEVGRWDVNNTDIEYWTRATRLGLNLPLYFLHINDRNYFAETNEALVKKAFEKE